MTNWKLYVLWFAQEHVDFRYAEIKSILKTYEISYKLPLEFNELNPYWLIYFQTEDAAKQLASRSVSLRCILELWSHSEKFQTFHTNLQNYCTSYENQLIFDKTFRICVETYNRHFSQTEKVNKMETLTYLPVRGNCNLKNPDIVWWYIEFYGLDPNDVPSEPNAIIFGRWIADGRRSLINDISLKTRKFIGNTSMDPQLSLLMANQAMIRQNDLIFDPFVGTGSLLVAAAKFGAFVLGGDIDFMMLHGKTRPSRISQKVREKDESIRANLRQYNCEHLYVDVLVSDFSKSIWSDRLQFNSIITDPPYGIREAVEKVEAKFRSKPNSRTENDQHYPSTSPYNLSNLYADLLNFAARHLILGGRLVCWLPVHKNDYNENMIPQHPCLELVANSEQDISAMTSRRLLTYEKLFENDMKIDGNDIAIMDNFDDFRNKFFSYAEDTRQERRIKQAELREMGRQEALKRGKHLDENGRVVGRSK